MTEDVVVFKVDPDAAEFRRTSCGRGNIAEAKAFCRRPTWPYKVTEQFVAVDDWGYNSGTIVAATPDLGSWIGKTFREFQAAVH